MRVKREYKHFSRLRKRRKKRKKYARDVSPDASH
jgi:hypothetical protein